MRRFAADIALFLSVVLLPPPAALLIAAALFFVFPNFYELLAVGLAADLLYGAPVPRFFDIPYVLSLVSLALFLFLSLVKRRVRVLS